MFAILRDVKEYKEQEISKRESVKKRMSVEVSTVTSRMTIEVYMNERYEVQKIISI